MHIHRHPSNEKRARYGEKAHLLFTDTDSLMYHIETPDVYKDMVDMKEHFNMSNFAPTNPYYEPGFGTNKGATQSPSSWDSAPKCTPSRR